jgi:hypothetical protein
MIGHVIKNSKKKIKNFHEYINVFMKSFGDCFLIGRWSIFDPKRQYNPYKSPPINNKDGFVLLLWKIDGIQKNHLKNCIDLMFAYNVNNFINKR